MTIADGRNRLQKIAFSVGGRTFKFALNPENMNHNMPSPYYGIKNKESYYH
uniref:Uncharacterized protein n=1 Tax=Bacillus phage phiBTP1 TaxID=1308894 RepID=R9RW79_9CAUD|nr:hypothetical protein BTP1_4 [Bacillus phage phiBTP1]